MASKSTCWISLFPFSSMKFLSTFIEKTHSHRSLDPRSLFLSHTHSLSLSLSLSLSNFYKKLRIQIFLKTQFSLLLFKIFLSSSKVPTLSLSLSPPLSHSQSPSLSSRYIFSQHYFSELIFLNLEAHSYKIN